MWKRKQSETPPAPEPSAPSQPGSVHRAQRRLADQLNRRTAHWTKRQKILFLLIACGCFATLNMVLLLTGKSKLRSNLYRPVGTISIPKYWFDPDAKPVFTRDDSAAMMGFRLRIDSLLSTPEGKRQLDSVQLSRPGWLDSMMHVERQFFPTLPPIQIHSSLNDNKP
jgi:hypothetical protein